MALNSIDRASFSFLGLNNLFNRNVRNQNKDTIDKTMQDEGDPEKQYPVVVALCSVLR